LKKKNILKSLAEENISKTELTLLNFLNF